MANEKVFSGFAIRNLAITDDRKRISIMCGCDGNKHAIWTVKEYLSKDLIVTEFAEDLGVKVIGPCNGSCKGKKKVGEFL